MKECGMAPRLDLENALNRFDTSDIGRAPVAGNVADGQQASARDSHQK
jgi:hypothetical protein